MMVNNLAMAFVMTLGKEFVLTIQGIVLLLIVLVMAEKKLLVDVLLHLKIHHSTSLQTLAFLTGYIVVKGKEQSFITDNVIVQTATMNTISASTARILVKMSYEPSQSLIQKNKFQAERTTFNCSQTPASLTTASLVAMKF